MAWCETGVDLQIATALQALAPALYENRTHTSYVSTIVTSKQDLSTPHPITFTAVHVIGLIAQ